MKNDEDFVAAKDHVHAEPSVDLGLGHAEKLGLGYVKKCDCARFSD